jgi:hypothetical protein
MTAFGKILVFFNLIFSVATAAMIVIVFTTRANWKKEYEKAKDVALIAEAKYKERTSEIDSLKSSYTDETKSKDTLIQSQSDTIGKLRDELAAEKKATSTEKTKYDKENTSQTSLKTEVGFLKTEREQLNVDNTKLKKDLADQIVLTNDQKRIAVENKIEADTQRARADRMLRRNEELERDNITLVAQNKALLAEGASKGGSSLLNPPPLPAPKDVNGTVTAVTSTGLVQISIGSDSGINVGNKLQISRYDLVNPDKSMYLGELVISRVEPKSSVGQFYPQQFARANEKLPKVNDSVTTGVSGPGR